MPNIHFFILLVLLFQGGSAQDFTANAPYQILQTEKGKEGTAGPCNYQPNAIASDGASLYVLGGQTWEDPAGGSTCQSTTYGTPFIQGRSYDGTILWERKLLADYGEGEPFFEEGRYRGVQSIAFATPLSRSTGTTILKKYAAVFIRSVTTPILFESATLYMTSLILFIEAETGTLKQCRSVANNRYIYPFRQRDMVLVFTSTDLTQESDLNLYDIYYLRYKGSDGSSKTTVIRRITSTELYDFMNLKLANQGFGFRALVVYDEFVFVGGTVIVSSSLYPTFGKLSPDMTTVYWLKSATYDLFSPKKGKWTVECMTPMHGTNLILAVGTFREVDHRPIAHTDSLIFFVITSNGATPTSCHMTVVIPITSNLQHSYDMLGLFYSMAEDKALVVTHYKQNGYLDATIDEEYQVQSTGNDLKFLELTNFFNKFDCTATSDSKLSFKSADLSIVTNYGPKVCSQEGCDPIQVFAPALDSVDPLILMKTTSIKEPPAFISVPINSAKDGMILVKPSLSFQTSQTQTLNNAACHSLIYTSNKVKVVTEKKPFWADGISPPHDISDPVIMDSQSISTAPFFFDVQSADATQTFTFDYSLSLKSGVNQLRQAPFSGPRIGVSELSSEDAAYFSDSSLVAYDNSTSTLTITTAAVYSKIAPQAMAKKLMLPIYFERVDGVRMSDFTSDYLYFIATADLAALIAKEFVVLQDTRPASRWEESVEYPFGDSWPAIFSLPAAFPGAQTEEFCELDGIEICSDPSCGSLVTSQGGILAFQAPDYRLRFGPLTQINGPSTLNLEAFCSVSAYWPRRISLTFSVVPRTDSRSPYTCDPVLDIATPDRTPFVYIVGSDPVQLKIGDLVLGAWSSSTNPVFVTCIPSPSDLRISPQTVSGVAITDSSFGLGSDLIARPSLMSGTEESYELKAIIQPPATASYNYIPVSATKDVTLKKCSPLPTASLEVLSSDRKVLEVEYLPNSLAYATLFRENAFAPTLAWSSIFNLEGASVDCLTTSVSTSATGLSNSNLEVLQSNWDIQVDTAGMGEGTTTLYLLAQYAGGPQKLASFDLKIVGCSSANVDYGFKFKLQTDVDGRVLQASQWFLTAGVTPEPSDTYGFTITDYFEVTSTVEACKPTMMDYSYSIQGTPTTGSFDLAALESPALTFTPLTGLISYSFQITIKKANTVLSSAASVTLIICRSSELSVAASAPSTLSLGSGQTSDARAPGLYVHNLRDLFDLSAANPDDQIACQKIIFRLCESALSPGCGLTFSLDSRLKVQNFEAETIQAKPSADSIPSTQDRLVVDTSTHMPPTLVSIKAKSMGLDQVLYHSLTVSVCIVGVVRESRKLLPKVGPTYSFLVQELLAEHEQEIASSFCSITHFELSPESSGETLGSSSKVFELSSVPDQSLTIRSSVLAELTEFKPLEAELLGHTAQGEIRFVVHLDYEFIASPKHNITDEANPNTPEFKQDDLPLSWAIDFASPDLHTGLILRSPNAYDGDQDEIAISFSSPTSFGGLITLRQVKEDGEIFFQGEFNLRAQLPSLPASETVNVTLSDGRNSTVYPLTVLVFNSTPSEGSDFSEEELVRQVELEARIEMASHVFGEAIAESLRDKLVSDSPEPTLTLESVSATGHARILFSELMHVPVSKVDYSTAFEIQFISPEDGSSSSGVSSSPSESRRRRLSCLLLEECRAQALGFSWEVVNHEPAFIDLKFKFGEPTSVSTSGKDKVQLTVTSGSFFLTLQSKRFVEPAEQKPSEIIVPPQMVNELLAAVIKETAEKAVSTVNFMAASNFVISFLLGGTLQQLWSTVRAIQIIMLSAVMEIGYPAHLSLFYSYCVVMAELDILNGPFWYDKLFEFRETAAFSPAFELFEMDSMNFFNNSGSIVLIFFGILLTALASKLLFAVASSCCKAKRGHRFRAMLKPYTSLWEPSFKLFYEGYTDIVMASFLGMASLSGSSTSDRFGTRDDFVCSLITMVSFAGVLTLPFWLSVALQKAGDPEELESRFGGVLEDLKPNSFRTTSFSVFSCVRRLLLVFFLLQFNSLPAIQAKLIIELTLAAIAFLLYTSPYKDKRLQRFEFFNDLTCLLSAHFHHCFLLESGYAEASQEFKFYLGWVVLGTISLNIGTNLVFVGIGSVRTMVLAYRRVKARRARKKADGSQLKGTDGEQPESEKGSSGASKQRLPEKKITDRPLRRQRTSMRGDSTLILCSIEEADFEESHRHRDPLMESESDSFGEASPSKKKVAAKMKKKSGAFSFRATPPQVHSKILEPPIDFSKRTPALKASKLTLDTTIASLNRMPFREQMTAIPAILDCFLMMEPWVAYKTTLRNPKASVLSKQLGKLSSRAASQALEQLLATTHIKRVMNFQVLDPYKVFHLFAGLTAINVQESPFHMTISHSFKCLTCEETEVVEANSMALALDVPNESVDVEDLLEDLQVGRALTIRRCSSCQTQSLQQHAQSILGEPEILTITFSYKEPSSGETVGGVQVPQGHLVTQEPLAMSLAAEEEVPVFFIDSCQSWKSKQVPFHINFIDGFLKQKGCGPKGHGLSAHKDQRPASKRVHLPSCLHLPSAKFNLCSWIEWTGKSYSAMKPPQPSKSVVADKVEIAFYTIE